LSERNNENEKWKNGSEGRIMKKRERIISPFQKSSIGKALHSAIRISL